MAEYLEEEIVRPIDTREGIKVVVDNRFIMTSDLSNLSIQARKLLYLTISQCRKEDDRFFTYEISPALLAEKLNIKRNHLYEMSQKITGELLGKTIMIEDIERKKYTGYTIFSKCSYDHDKMFRMKFNPDMSEFFLGLKESFTQVLLDDFMGMKSVYSLPIWHLMELKMHGRKPGTRKIEFDISIDELRTVTGTQNKLKQLVNFKEKALNKAIEEIRECAGVDVSYSDLKEGRTVTGFHFIAKNIWGIDLDDYVPTPEVLAKAEEIKRKYQGEEGANENY